MRRVLATLVALSLVMAMFTGGFTTVPKAKAAGPAPIDLGAATNFAILSYAAITDVPTSHITGDVGATPITGAAIGLTSPEVTGTIYTVDAGGPAGSVIDSSLLTTAKTNMGTAYTVAENAPHGTGATNLNVGGGTLNGQTFVPGIYTWNTPGNVSITGGPTGGITLTGTATDVWIFQITGTLDLAPDTKITLGGEAQAKNIFWQVAGVVTLLANSHFEGNILGWTTIAMKTGASINGRLLAQTEEVTLEQNTVKAPQSAGLPGTITIIKDTVPNGPQDFSFTTTGGLYATVGSDVYATTFSLDDDADPTLLQHAGLQ